MMKKLMNRMMLSCHKASELIEKKLNFRLTTIEKVQLFFHKSMCDACRNYEKQSRFIDEALKRHISFPDKEFKLSQLTLDVDKLKQRLINNIKKK